MKVNLSMLERIILQNALPREGKFTDLIIKKGFLKKIAITTEDIEAHTIVTQDNGNITWDDKNCKEGFDIEVVVNEVIYLSKWLDTLSEQEKLPEDLFDFYEKIKALL